MKLLIQTIALLALLLVAGCTVQQYSQAPANTYTPAPAPTPAPVQPQAQQQGVTLQLFYDQLGPYGQWIENPQYGYVWIPDVGPDFRPYATNGHWEYTEYGWMWDSDYPWGWAAFHYGRWYYDNIMGYAWIPDTQWGPAWVTWRSSPEYYGWAPMGPGGYEYPQERWVFVQNNYIYNPHVYNYYQPPQNNYIVYNQTTVVQNNYIVYNNERYIGGPDIHDVERITGTQVKPVAIRQSTNPGQTGYNNGQYLVYKPQITLPPANTPVQPKPVKVVPRTEVVPISQRKATVQPNAKPGSQPNNAPPANKPTTSPQSQKIQPSPTEIQKLPVAPSPTQKGEMPTPAINIQAPPTQKIAIPSPAPNIQTPPTHNVTTVPVQKQVPPPSAPAQQVKPKTKVVKPAKLQPTKLPTSAPPAEKHP